MIPRPVVDCIAAAREPSWRELRAVADYIRTDLSTWKRSTLSDKTAQLLSLRAAKAAMTGSP